MPLIRQSWTFDIVDSVTQQTEESWTLVIPPRSTKIDEGTRSKITKTFQRVFIDDYGPDNPEIVISGYSGAARAFPTWSTLGQNNGREFAEREAFYEFRDRILHYRYRENFEKKQLHVFDNADLQSYNCFLLKFSLDRSQDTPMKYPYSIELFVINRLSDKVAIPSAPILPPTPNSESTAIESLMRAEEANNRLAKGIRSDDLNTGRTNGELESSEDETALWDFANRGGTYAPQTNDSEVILNYPEGTISQAEDANLKRIIQERRAAS